MLLRVKIQVLKPGTQFGDCVGQPCRCAHCLSRFNLALSRTLRTFALTTVVSFLLLLGLKARA
eukprot:IDg17365t1